MTPPQYSSWYPSPSGPCRVPSPLKWRRPVCASSAAGRPRHSPGLKCPFGLGLGSSRSYHLRIGAVEATCSNSLSVFAYNSYTPRSALRPGLPEGVARDGGDVRGVVTVGDGP
jgi:hypothetical protein